MFGIVNPVGLLAIFADNYLLMRNPAVVRFSVLVASGTCTPSVTSGGLLSSRDKVLSGMLSNSWVGAVAAGLSCSDMKAAAFFQSEAFMFILCHAKVM